MNIIHCPKFLKLFPLSVRICITALVRGFILGEGGECGEVGKAFVDVSAFMVTMNCSFKASYPGSASWFLGINVARGGDDETRGRGGIGWVTINRQTNML